MMNLIIMTQSRLAKGAARPNKYRKKPTMMNAQRLAVAKNVPISTWPKTLRKTTKAGEYKKIAKRTCRVVKVPTESTCAAVSSRSALFSSDFIGALKACWSTRGRLATFRTVLQSLSSARTGTNHPAACSCCARRAMRIECPPASAKPSSNPNGVSNTALQIASTSSHSGSMPASASGGLTSPCPVSRALASVPRLVFSAPGSVCLSR